MKTGFGIIGCGFMGHVHLKNLLNREDVHIAAICDIDPEQLRDVPEEIATFTDPADLVKCDGVDVILIAANNDQHRKLTELAAGAGKHVLCEKPVALSVSDLDAMDAVCREAGVTFTVHQQRRFDPDYRTSKAVFDSGALGDIYTVKSQLYGFNGNMHDWHVFKDQGGGMLYDWGVHLIDQMLWMIPGKVSSVFADVRNVINKEVDDYFHIMLRFEHGMIGQIELGTYYLNDTDGWFERHWFIGGNKGSMHCDGFDPNGSIVRTTELLTSVAGKRTMTAAGPTRSFGPPPEGRIVSEPLPEMQTKHSMYFDNYLAALRDGKPFLVTIPEVRRVLCLMDAIRESARTGRSVDFES